MLCHSFGRFREDNVYLDESPNGKIETYKYMQMGANYEEDIFSNAFSNM